MAPQFFFFFFLLVPSHLSLAQTKYTNITTGTTLTPLRKPTSWPSPSGDFAFGFLPHPANASLSLLAVWFDKMDNKTIVWCANGDRPVAADGSKLTLKPDGQLSLTDPSGLEIWNPGASGAAHAAAVLDTGNLVLSAADSRVLWQSFDHPTDTILPGQTLQQGAQVFARLADADYARGRFVLALLGNGNLAMFPVAYPTPTHYPEAYWDSDTSGTGAFQLIYNESGSIDLSHNSTLLSVISTAVPGDHYHRATLDSDGIFRQYAFPKNEPGTGDWMVNQALAKDICSKLLSVSGSGACGFNSYCTMGSDERVACLCPPNYSFVDDGRKYLGCKPNFVAQSCEPGGEASFDFQVVTYLDWPWSDAESFSSMNETECRANCLKDCFCAAAIYNNGNCWKKKYPLSNGRFGNDVNRHALVKYSTRSSSARPDQGERRPDWRIRAVGASSFLAGSAALNLALLAACLLVSRSKPRRLVGTSSGVAGPSLCSFTYRELETATEGFSEELGRGAFGTVYKGALAAPDHEVLPIAVKKLECVHDDELEAAEKDFMNEIRTIGMTHHKNLVRLLGFCKEGTRRLLVYEFMSNGSLHKFLFGGPVRPGWSRRVEIALGVARGLAYLHEECRTQIIHCDIKPHNVLVDDGLAARISDFGMAKLLRLEQTRTSTGIRGTVGYFAPEWFKNSAITAKVDVYSFGVLLLEIVFCRRNLDWGYDLESETRPTLTDRAKECCRTGRLNELLGEEDEEAKKDGMRLERFVMVGLSCVQEEPWMRPNMKKVVQMLEGSTEVDVPPNMYSLTM
ncbi:G-type lectin S-receptor-like serine/threonine-protein kinase LECRK2 [Iris pallida]|uniref:Receptor-like serine/threonine-protein kinase n=1 Tax=Iris pallida TaxID=29817 RepID=A0AAX6EQM4_IRIPA|nr:G-type lectin S-receptor-like serine/threonine-protein kinase LECRK2 [Iris pallida]